MGGNPEPLVIAVVCGSTRPGNLGSAISQWVLDTVAAQAPAHVRYQLLLLPDLPLLDEPGIPAYHPPEHEHTKAWQAKVHGIQGFVFVTPQYNWGVPAALKNALDYLFKEWNGKPGAIVSYGGHGGGKAASQLRQVLEGLRMVPVDPMVPLTLSKAQIGKQEPLNPSHDFAAQAGDVLSTAKAVEQALLQGS